MSEMPALVSMSKNIEFRFQPVEHVEEMKLLLVGQVRQFLHAGAGGHDADIPRAGDDDVLDRFLPGENVGYVVPGRQAEQDVDVGEAQVRVHDEHPLSEKIEGHGEVDRHVALADARPSRS